MTDTERIADAARALVAQLDLIHADEQYKSVWSLAMIHGTPYHGPDYSAQLAALRDALAHPEPEPVQNFIAAQKPLDAEFGAVADRLLAEPEPSGSIMCLECGGLDRVHKDWCSEPTEARLNPAKPEPVFECGPWYAASAAEKGVYIGSDDFTHDVRLYVNGDFANDQQRMEYAREIAQRLNRKHPEPEPVREDARDAARYRWLRDPLSDAYAAYQPRGDYGKGLKTGSALDAAIDAALEATREPRS